MTCRSCGHDNRIGRRFCAQCGAQLALVCTNMAPQNEASPSAIDRLSLSFKIEMPHVCGEAVQCRIPRDAHVLH